MSEPNFASPIHITLDNNLLSVVVTDKDTSTQYIAEVNGERLSSQLSLLFDNVNQLHEHLKEELLKGTVKLNQNHNIEFPIFKKKTIVLPTETIQANDLQSLRRKIRSLDMLREEDAKHMNEIVERHSRQIENLKDVIRKLQRNFELYYY